MIRKPPDAGEGSAGLEIAGLSHRFPDTPSPALLAVDLAVAAGEVHCLLGPSGSGKSTLLRLVAGLEPLQEGTVTVSGTMVASRRLSIPPERRSVGFVFQDYALFPHLDVLGNVTFGMDRLGREGRLQAAEALLERVGMLSFKRALPHTLSGGEQQRVALARALARSPRVMLLDESFSGLEPSLRRSVREQTLAILRDDGVATLLVTHDSTEAMAAADRISVIEAGRILQTGSTTELYHRPSSLAVAQAFGPVNQIVGERSARGLLTPVGRLPPGGSDLTGESGPCIAFVRPESLELVTDSTAAAGDGARGVVVSVRSEGALVIVEVELADAARLAVALLAREPPTIGSAVRVRLRADSL